MEKMIIESILNFNFKKINAIVFIEPIYVNHFSLNSSLNAYFIPPKKTSSYY